MPEPEFVEMPESFRVNLYRTHGVKAANVGNVGENVGMSVKMPEKRRISIGEVV